MDDLIVKLNEKLDSAVKKLRDGNYDDHDILPALLWVLLEYNRSHRDDLEQMRERTDRTSAEISGLAKTLQEECEKLQQKTSEDLIKARDDLGTRIGGLAQTLQEECEKLQQKTSEDLIKARDDLGTRIGGLAQTLQEECEKLRHQLGSIADSMGAVLKPLNEDLNKALQQNALQLQKLVETKVGSLSEAHQSGVLRTDNKLKWILVGSIFQIIFILIVMFLIFGK